ncbi:MAG TPA: acyl carrier protein [Solirubrobacteraceae bacterium]|nr:acyl carrier protein [Solirubrobacteraceae bacterium]
MTSEEEILARVGRIFEDTLSMSAPAPDLDIIEAALLDSLTLVSLLFAIEQEFAIEIPLDTLEIDSLRTLASIATMIAAAGVSS